MAPETAPDLDPRITSYVERVRAWCRGGPVTRARLDALREHAAELVSRPLALPAHRRVVPARGYGRNLLHRDDEHGFVVLAMVWPGGVGGHPHDHRTWGVVAISEGEIEVVDYAETALDDRGERVRLTQRSRIVGGPGATAFVLPPDDDVHRVTNAHATNGALSIHTYGRHIDGCRVFELDPRTHEARVTWAVPEYHSIP